MTQSSSIDALQVFEVTSSPIQTEEAFHEAASTMISEKKSYHQDEKFAELAKYIHEALKSQDSDAALTILTKGAL